MAKFGELINSDLPILLDFYTEWNETSSSMRPVLRDVAAAIGDKGKVVKINVDKNNELCLLYTSPSPRDLYRSRMPSSA